MRQDDLLKSIKSIKLIEPIDMFLLQDSLEFHLIDQAMSLNNNKVSRAALYLKINRTTLAEKIRRRRKLQAVAP